MWCDATQRVLELERLTPGPPQFSALFRVPLNVLVTISLITGAEEHKDMVILASVAMLGFGSIAMFLGIRTRV